MDLRMMERAYELALRGRGRVSPNPMVGALLVMGDLILAEGWHDFAGGPHAEIVAMSHADPERVRGADLYVTLEPCCHFGKTGPCVDQIISLGVRRVFVGMLDPFERVNGNGVKALEDAGLVVEFLDPSLELYKKIRFMNRHFLKTLSAALPYVTLKLGMSLDARIADSFGESKWITSKAARMDAKLERGFCDAVLVGAGSVRSDDPELGVVAKSKSRDILRVVVVRSLNFTFKEKIFRDENVFVATVASAGDDQLKKLKQSSIRFGIFGEGKLDFEALFSFLFRELAVNSVYVEGGSTMHSSLLEAALLCPVLLDEVLFYIAPKLLLSASALPGFALNGSFALSGALRLKDVRVDFIGDDLKYRGLLNSY